MSRTFDEKEVTLANGLRTHYLEWPGSGPTLLFLHPSVGYGRIWEWVVNALGADYHVFAPDQRGHGKTDRPDGSYAAEEYAGDAVLFMDAVGIDKAVVVGHSLGGRVAQVLAADYPDRVAGIALVAGPHLSNFFPTRDAAMAIIENVRATIHDPDSFASVSDLRAFMVKRTPWIGEPDAAIEHRIEHNCAVLADGSLAPRYDNVRVAQGLMHMADDLRPYAAKARCPVLFLRAAQGNLPREKAEQLAGLWQDARIVDVDGTYALQLQNPESVAAALRPYVAELLPA